MIRFTPRGPFAIPLSKGPGGRTISLANVKAFWTTHATYQDDRGVYVFAIRSGGGLSPTYVGKAAEQTFGIEALHAHKRADHYNVTLAHYAKGTPVLFLFVPQSGTMPTKRKAIDALETALIAEAIRVNPDGLTNHKKKPKPPLWAINGVVRSGTGKPSKSAKAARLLFDL